MSKREWIAIKSGKRAYISPPELNPRFLSPIRRRGHVISQTKAQTDLEGVDLLFDEEALGSGANRD